MKMAKVKVTKKNWTEVWKAALAAAAEKAGMDLAELKMNRFNVDRTWGDQVGMGFYGAAPEVNKRAAAHFAAWVNKHVACQFRTYDAQYHVGETLEMTHYEYTNGCTGWTRKPEDLHEGEYAQLVGTTPGTVVPFVYYPGMD